MIKQLKQFTLNLVAGANVVTIVLMLAAGFSDRLDPVGHPILCSAGMVFPFFLLANLCFLFFWLIFSKKRALIPVIGYVFAYVPIKIYMPINVPKDMPEEVLKVMSYNVCGYGGNYKYDNGFDTVYHYIEQQQPDIVCLQEDIDTWRRYVFDRYKKFLPYNDTTVVGRSSKFENYLGIHTRFPIIRKERLPIASLGNGAVAYYLKTDSDTLIVINCHLESVHLSKKDRKRYKEMLKGEMERDTVRSESLFLIDKLGMASAKRSQQAKLVHDYIEAHAGSRILVCGDFNDTPISFARHTISKGLTDCFVAAGNGFGLSYNQKGFNFRIDHVLCSSHFEPIRCEVDDKMDASDHYPLICWLKMVPNP